MSERKRQHDGIGVFFHIPKTAGITLHHVIYNAYDATEVFQTPSAPAAIESWKKATREVRKRTQFITGHMFFDFWEAFAKSDRLDFVTLLRHPVDRVISNYYHLRRHPELPAGRRIVDEDIGLEECMRTMRLVGHDNTYARRLSGIDRPDRQTPFGEVSAEHLRRATENLEQRFSVVGLTEEFDESLRMLTRHFGWPECPYEEQNVAPNKPGGCEPEADVRRLIEQQNEIDMALYEVGRRRFEELRVSPPPLMPPAPAAPAAPPAPAAPSSKFRTLAGRFARS